VHNGTKIIVRTKGRDIYYYFLIERQSYSAIRLYLGHLVGCLDELFNYKTLTQSQLTLTPLVLICLLNLDKNINVCEIELGRAIVYEINDDSSPFSCTPGEMNGL